MRIAAASNPSMLPNLARVVFLAPLLLAGCGSAEPAAIDAPRDAPNLGEIRYTCDGPPGFLPALLDQPANAETEDHPSAVALRAAIAEGGPDIDMLPEFGYWLASRDERVAVYLAAEPAGADPAFVSAIIENRARGWQLAGWGQCRPSIVLEGLSRTTWTLDPDVPAPAADATTFTALVTETECTSGQPMGGRLLPPSITHDRDAVFVVFAALPQVNQGFATCPSNPPSRVIVTLHEPLGDRRLLDAGVFPPAEP
jgi:hypothetical protein